MWTDAIEATAKAAWEAGRSANQCSADIHAVHGVWFTRSAVIGKVHRRGWQTPTLPRGGRNHLNPDPIARAKRKAKAERKHQSERWLMPGLKQRTRGSSEERPWQTLRSAPVRRHADAIDARPSRNLTLLELSPCDCRYATSPHESRAHLFCGAPIAEDASYCSHHLAVCHGREA